MSCRKSIASLGGHRDAAAMSNPASAFVTPSPQASGVAQVKNMACSSTALFSEPEDFEAAAWAASRPRLLVTAPGCFKARLTEVALGAMRLSAVEEALHHIAVLKVPADIVLVMLPIGRLSAPVWGGVMSQQWELTTHGPGQRLYGWTGGPCRSGGHLDVGRRASLLRECVDWNPVRGAAWNVSMVPTAPGASHPSEPLCGRHPHCRNAAWTPSRTETPNARSSSR